MKQFPQTVPIVVGGFLVHDVCPNSVNGRAEGVSDVSSDSLVLSSQLDLYRILLHFHNLAITQEEDGLERGANVVISAHPPTPKLEKKT